MQKFTVLIAWAWEPENLHVMYVEGDDAHEAEFEAMRELFIQDNDVDTEVTIEMENYHIPVTFVGYCVRAD